MDGAFRTARVAFVPPAPITGQGVHVVAAAQLLQRFRRMLAIRATAMRGIPCANVIFLLLQETLAVLVGETNGGAL